MAMCHREILDMCAGIAANREAEKPLRTWAEVECARMRREACPRHSLENLNHHYVTLRRDKDGLPPYVDETEIGLSQSEAIKLAREDEDVIGIARLILEFDEAACEEMFAEANPDLMAERAHDEWVDRSIDEMRERA